MTTAGQIYMEIDRLAPFSGAEAWDNSGLLVGDAGSAVGRILVTLDVGLAAVEQAVKLGAQLIVSHHPVIFDPQRRFLSGSPAYRAAANGIAVISAHTSYDNSPLGTNLALSELLCLREPKLFGAADGSGTAGMLGRLEPSMNAMELAWYAKAKTGGVVRYTVSPEKIERVAVCGGSGGEFFTSAMAAGAQAFITGEVKHHQFVEAQRLGFTLIEAGHYATEQPAAAQLARQLGEAFPGLEISLFDGAPVECI